MAHGDPNWQVSVREHIELDELLRFKSGFI